MYPEPSDGAAEGLSGAHLAPSRPFARALTPRGACLSLGAVGLSATLGCWPFGGGDRYAPVVGNIYFNNANDHEIAIHIRPLRGELELDCDVVMAEPGRLLSPQAFGEAEHWLLPPRTNVGIAPELEIEHAQACGAAWIAGEGIEPAIVAVEFDAFPLGIFDGQTFTPDELEAGGVAVEFGEDGRSEWIGNLDILASPSDAAPEQPPSCEAPSGEHPLDWSVDVPIGEVELLDLELGADGCHELLLQPVALDAEGEGVETEGEPTTFYLCAPTNALPLAVNERLWITTNEGSHGRLLHFTLLDPDTLEVATDEQGEDLRRVWYYRDAPGHGYREHAFDHDPEVIGASACPWQVESGCATAERRAVLVVDQIPLELGVPHSNAGNSGTRVVTSIPTYVRERALVDPSCSSGSLGLNLDYVIIVEPLS